MQSRILQFTVLALLFAFASPVVAAEADGDKAAFRVAYKAYQAAVEARDADAAVIAAHDALHHGESIFPDDSASLAALHINYGMALVDTKRAKDAMEPLRNGIKRYEELYGKKDERLIDPLWSLADAYHKTLDHEKALSSMRRALRIVKKIHGEGSFAFAEASLTMGEMFYRAGQPRATFHFQAAYDTYQQIYGKPAYKTGIAAFWLGKAAQQQGRRDRAEANYLDALEIFENSTSPGHDLQVAAHAYLIEVYEGRGRSDEATMHCQAISRIRPLVGVDGYKPLYRGLPNYPRSAQRGGRSGWVLVEFTVTTLGTVADAAVVESDGGADFERSALKAVAGFRYAPAVEDGKLVNSTGVRNLITFEIVD
ncbi:MAG: TonB family protein [Proteobacteria bacterium]|nr:TonB family protein [Pseudomonadota bacterium]